MSERLHKVLAQHGLGSRRELERWIAEGRIRLNGQPAQAGAQFMPGDRVSIDGNDITARLRATAPQVILYHKPQHQPVGPKINGAAGHESESADEEFKESVLERLPAQRGARWLVINTMQTGDSGLLLLTTDGRLADALRRRAETIPAAYAARVLVPTLEFDIATVPLTVRYDEESVEFASIEAAGGEGANRWFLVQAGHSHRRAAVRALFESRGLGVSRVSQVRFASLELPRDLPRGKHRALTESQVRELYALAGLSAPPTNAEVRSERSARGNTARPQDGKANSKRSAADRGGGRAGRRPGGKAPLRPRQKPGQSPPQSPPKSPPRATGSRKSDR